MNEPSNLLGAGTALQLLRPPLSPQSFSRETRSRGRSDGGERPPGEYCGSLIVIHRRKRENSIRQIHKIGKTGPRKCTRLHRRRAKSSSRSPLRNWKTRHELCCN